jgi:hypothetical protein
VAGTGLVRTELVVDDCFNCKPQLERSVRQDVVVLPREEISRTIETLKFGVVTSLLRRSASAMRENKTARIIRCEPFDLVRREGLEPSTT